MKLQTWTLQAAVTPNLPGDSSGYVESFQIFFITSFFSFFSLVFWVREVLEKLNVAVHKSLESIEDGEGDKVGRPPVEKVMTPMMTAMNSQQQQIAGPGSRCAALGLFMYTRADCPERARSDKHQFLLSDSK